MTHEKYGNLAARLRAATQSIRTKPYPISDLIPLMQEAADAMDLMVASGPCMSQGDETARTPQEELDEPDHL